MPGECISGGISGKTQFINPLWGCQVVTTGLGGSMFSWTEPVAIEACFPEEGRGVVAQTVDAVLRVTRGVVFAREGGVAAENEDGCRRRCGSSPPLALPGAEVGGVGRVPGDVVTAGEGGEERLERDG